MPENCCKSLFRVKDGVFTFGRFYSKMTKNAWKLFIFCDFPETAKNYFIKMNAFRGFSAKFNESEPVFE